MNLPYGMEPVTLSADDLKFLGEPAMEAVSTILTDYEGAIILRTTCPIEGEARLDFIPRRSRGPAGRDSVGRFIINGDDHSNT